MPTIKQEIAKGVFWIAVARYSGIFISLAITAVLARNVSPAAFGTMAVATVIMAFLDIFTEFGIGPAVIQFKDLTRRDLSSLFMIGGGIGIVLGVALFLCAPVVARFYDDMTLVPVVRLLCICLLFNSLNVVPNGLMLKAKRFRTVALRTLSFQLLCGCVAVWGALHGWGIYALIVTPIVTSVGVFIVNYVNYPLSLSLAIDFSPLRKVWGFSAYQFMFSFVNYFSRNLDKLIVGKYFSMSELGYYDKSYRLMQLPLSYITFVIGPVLHPILSSLQDDKAELARKNLKLVTLLSYISFPLGILLFFTSGEIIRIIFGPNWAPAVPVFSILALSLPLQIILSTSGAIYQAAGKTKHMFFCGLQSTVTTVSAFFIAALLFRTIESMAWAWDISLLINFIACYIVMNRITFRASLRRYFLSYLPQTVNTLIVAILSWLIFSHITIHSDILSLLFKTTIVGLSTIIMAHLLHQYYPLVIVKRIFNRMAKQISLRFSKS